MTNTRVYLTIQQILMGDILNHQRRHQVMITNGGTYDDNVADDEAGGANMGDLLSPFVSPRFSSLLVSYIFVAVCTPASPVAVAASPFSEFACLFFLYRLRRDSFLVTSIPWPSDTHQSSSVIPAVGAAADAASGVGKGDGDNDAMIQSMLWQWQWSNVRSRNGVICNRRKQTKGNASTYNNGWMDWHGIA